MAQNEKLIERLEAKAEDLQREITRFNERLAADPVEAFRRSEEAISATLEIRLISMAKAMLRDFSLDIVIDELDRSIIDKARQAYNESSTSVMSNVVARQELAALARLREKVDHFRKVNQT